MYKKTIAVALTAIVSCLSTIAQAQGQPDKTASVQAQVRKIGTGESSVVRVKLKDGTEHRGYLSQIENDKIQQPSPNVLHALAEIYGIDYGQLMEMAGHITPSKSRSHNQRHGRVATFADHNLTPAEEAELIEYLQFIRRRKRSSAKTG